MANYTDNMTLETAYASLRSVGQAVAPEDAEVLVRDDRWAVVMPGERIAWFPSSEAGRQRLAIERRVLGLVAARCSFDVPQLLFVSDTGFDIRRKVSGRSDPFDLFQRCKRDPSLARAIGRSLGAMLAEQHTMIRRADVAGWLRYKVEWPESGTWIRERLRRVVADGDLIRAMEQVIERYEKQPIDADDCAMVHGDIGFHNLAIDPQTSSVNGIFDYDGAAWADRHHDFRGLIFDVGRNDMLEAALAVYEPAVNWSIERGRVHLYNAASAICYLAYRDGVEPEQRWCGRTLDEDLRWVREAMSALA